MHVCICCVCFSFSVLRQDIGSEERLRNDLFYVEWDVKPLTQSITPQLQSITALWPVLISRPAEGRRLSWSGWLVIY